MSENKYGFKNLTKWLLVERAPFTASGLNEIISAGRTRAEVATIAKALGFRTGSRDWHAIEKLEETA